MNTVIFLFRVSRRIRPAETYRKRLSSTFRYLSEIRKRLFSPCANVSPQLDNGQWRCELNDAGGLENLNDESGHVYYLTKVNVAN